MYVCILYYGFQFLLIKISSEQISMINDTLLPSNAYGNNCKILALKNIFGTCYNFDFHTVLLLPIG